MMNKQQTDQKIQTLLQAMAKAIEEQQWQHIRHFDQQLMQTLNEAKLAPWYPSWQSRVSELKGEYSHFLALINAQKNELQTRMQQHQKDRDGIIAYKQFTDGAR